MKTLKLKVYLSCLLLAFAGSFFMTSCTSEENLDTVPQEELLIDKALLLPVSISEKGEKQVKTHLNNLNEDLKITYLNNFIVGKYLVALDKADMAFGNLAKAENISEIDLSPYLTSNQLTTLESERINSLPEIQVRGCTPIYQWNNCCWRNQWNQCVGCWKYSGQYCD